MTEKSILEQALLQVQTLEEAVKQNAKGILASTMKEELNELLKESEEEEDELPEEEENDMSDNPEDEESEDEMFDDEDQMGDDENMEDLDNEDPMKDIDSMDSGDDMEDPEMMDMTNASDDEVLRVFKSMKPEDGIVVKKDGDDIELDMDGDEYIIKLDEEEEDYMSGMDDEMEEGSHMSDMDDEMAEGNYMSDMDDEMEEETMYEIELDDEDDEMEEGDMEIEATEASRTYANDVRGASRQGKKYQAGRHEMNEEVEKLRKQNSEYKKALVLFKEKLNEVAVFNANLAYATRLFTEHSTTKQEKLHILKRFDTVSNMNESKNLFSSIKTELENKKPITESMVQKISSTPTSSSSQEVLSESKAYENPQFKRMKDLMGKIK